MVDDLDICRSAQVLVKRYWETAGFEAAKRVDAMIEAGDPEGTAVWKRILKAVEHLQRAKPGSGDVVH